MAKDYFNQKFDQFLGHKLRMVERDMHGRLVLTFEGDDDMVRSVAVAATPMGGINIKEV